MQRRLRITLVATAAAGAVALGTGTAYAEGVFKAPSGKDCSRSVDNDKPEKENDFPSDHEAEAEHNATPNDLRDASGRAYYIHNKFCDGPRPWRGYDWHDSSYDTFHNKRDPATGLPSRDKDENTFEDTDGYNSQFRKDKEKKHEPDHIGAPKHPRYANH